MERKLSTRARGRAVVNTGEEPAKIQLDREAWIETATEALAEEGLAGVRVEVLAKRRGVTKGSFYWHFKDRQDLLEAVLETWKLGRIRDIQKQTRAEAGQEAARLYHVIEVYSTARSRRGIRIELAVRDWARRDPQAAAVVQEVDKIRLECAKRLFLACGLSDQEAAARCLLLYAYVFGQSLMTWERFAPDIAELKAWIADRIAR
jgi:AcrR family transcriptional regulator